MTETLIRGSIINPQSPTEWELIEHGALVFDDTGILVAVGDYGTLSTTHPNAPCQDFSGKLILPGLIDTHIHLPQLPIRGKTADSLLAWLETHAFPIEEAFADTTYAQELSRQFFQQLLANGTTTALIFSSIHEASTHIGFEAAHQAGIRAIIGKVMMDQNAPDTLTETVDESIAISQRLASQWHQTQSNLLYYAFTPRFALSCSQPMLEAAATLQKQFDGSYIHSHLAENQAEIEAVEALYDNKLRYTDVYAKTGCLGTHTIMAHGIHLNDHEITLLHDTGTRISHCPSSNFFLKSGCFNLPRMQEAGIPFALGTDVGGGPDLSMFQVMRAMDAMQLERHYFVTPQEALYYATLGGATILSLDTITGNFTPGKSADFIVVSTDHLNTSPCQDSPLEEQLSQLMYLGDDRCIEKTFVQGTQVYSRHQLMPC